MLREYRPDDLQRVFEINDDAYPAVGRETIEALGSIADESMIRLVAEVDGAIAAFCLCLAPEADYDSVNFLWFRDRYDDFVYLDRVAVAPTFKRRGIGRAMYAEVERLIAERRPSATHFTLEVNLEPRNDDSLAFHGQMGFAEVGRQRTGHGTTVSLMAKPLRPAA